MPESLERRLVNEKDRAIVKNSIMSSIKRLEKECVLLYDEIREMKDKARDNPETYHIWSDSVDKLMRMQEMFLKRLGLLGNTISNTIIAKNVSIDNRSLSMALDKQLDFVFKNNDAIMNNGKIIFDNPSNELLEAYNKWKDKNKTPKMEIRA